MIHAHAVAGRTPLDALYFVDVLLGVRVPSTAGEFQCWPDQCLIGLLLEGMGADLKVSFQKSEGAICFGSDFFNVAFPGASYMEITDTVL